MISHESADPNARPFKCNICNRTYSQFSHLKEHRTRHLNNLPLTVHEFYCEMCSKTIYTRDRYELHLRHHIRHTGLILGEGEPIFLYICDYDGCQLCFRDKDRFVSHQETHSENRMVFTCPICQKTFAQESNCQKHVDWIHNQEKPNSFIDCTYCHMIFEKKDDDWEWHQAHHCMRLDEAPQGTHLCEACGQLYCYK